MSVDIRAKLISGLILLICAVSSSPFSAGEFAAVVLFILVVAVVFDSRPLSILKKSLIVLPFAGVIALLSPLAHYVALPTGTVASIVEAYRIGYLSIFDILSKAFISALIVTAVVDSVPVTTLFHGLAAVGIPNIFITLFTFLYRFSDLFRAQIKDMQKAIKSRAPQLGRVQLLVVYGKLGGNAFIRAYERGEEVYAAMISRGYTGTLPTSDVLHWRAIDTTAVAFACVFGLSVILYS